MALSRIASAQTLDAEARRRLDEDAAAGRPLIVHVVVALADNAHQGIVPVPAGIGNGQKPSTNLYWGAGYGVRWFFGHKAGWTELRAPKAGSPAVLERVVFRKELNRRGRKVTAYIVADAYDGARIREAVVDALEFMAGRNVQEVVVRDGAGDVSLRAGGASAVIAYVGHDGLMDFNIDAPAPPSSDTRPRAGIVLACVSKTFFGTHITRTGALPLLMTYGLMAPEAYTLEAALQNWLGGASPDEVREVAAQTYDRYQHCGLKGGRRLFGARVPSARAD